MFQKGIIEGAKSPWAYHVVLAPKMHGTLRFCVDYRKVTLVTIRDV